MSMSIVDGAMVLSIDPLWISLSVSFFVRMLGGWIFGHHDGSKTSYTAFSVEHVLARDINSKLRAYDDSETTTS